MEWFPAISTTAALTVCLWLARNFIITRLVRSVQHEFDKKLELIRTNLKNSEEQFKADLRIKEAEIDFLRSGAMTAMASRQIEIYKRRLEAVDELWSAIVDLGPAKKILMSTSVFDFDKIFERVPDDEKLRKFFSAVGNGIEEGKFDFSTPEKVRPFVSPMAWALFSAYQAIVFLAVTKVRLAQIGIGDKELLDTELAKKLVKTALPNFAEYIDEHGDRAYHLLIDPLEENLLEEFQKMMAGKEDDIATVELAGRILEVSRSVLMHNTNTVEQAAEIAKT